MLKLSGCSVCQFLALYELHYQGPVAVCDWLVWTTRAVSQAQPNHRSDSPPGDFDESCRVCSDWSAGNSALIVHWQETTEDEPGTTREHPNQLVMRCFELPWVFFCCTECLLLSTLWPAALSETGVCCVAQLLSQLCVVSRRPVAYR